MIVDYREINKCYENLANEIILQAVDDYRRLLRGKNVKPIDKCITIDSVEKFFQSKWFGFLTKVDGETIINRLRREYKNECKLNTKHT